MALEPYLGEIMLWPMDFVPRGWAFCDGRLMSVSQNTALFALLWNTFGGDARTTFGLPDLRGRVPVGAGQGPGLTQRYFGDSGGIERVSFSVTQLPELSGDPANPVLTLPAGQDSVSTLPPFLTLNYIIALQGVFPCRW